MEPDTQIRTNTHSIVHTALMLSLPRSITFILTLRCTQKCAHAYKPPTCFHHLAIPKLRCPWVRWAARGTVPVFVCVCVWCVVCVGVVEWERERERVSERERERERERPVIILSKREYAVYSPLQYVETHLMKNSAWPTESHHTGCIQAQHFHRKSSRTHLQHHRYMSCRQGFALGVVIAD